MTLLGFIVFVLIVGAAAIYFEDDWQSRLGIGMSNSPAKSDDPSALEKAGGEADGQADESKSGLFSTGTVRRVLDGLVVQAQSARALLPSGDVSPETITAFREWTESDSSLEAPLRKWLASLSDEQFAAFTHHVSDFCREVGMDLGWLVQGDLASHGGLAEHASQIVGSYCRSCFQAATAQPELIAFQAYQDYAQHPKRRQKFGEELLDELLKAGLTTISMESFLVASSEQRQEQVKEAIEGARQKAPDRFLSIVEDVLARTNQPVQAPEFGVSDAVQQPPASVNGTDSQAEQSDLDTAASQVSGS